MEWKELPKEIQEKMLYYQEKQIGKENESVFIAQLSAGKPEGGFTWEKTVEGHDFWKNILIHGNFKSFYEMYPKKTYPKVMLVRDSERDGWKKRVVFCEKDGKYVAWLSAETLEEAENYIGTCAWNMAKDIPYAVIITRKEIAEKFGVDPDYLEIVD